jgi:hypothetical protein
LTLAAAALAGSVLLSGCSAQWTSMSPSIAAVHNKISNHKVATVSKLTSTTVTPTATATATTAPDPFESGDLSTNSLVHQLPIGNHTLVVHYWTDSMLSTEAGNNVVHLSAALKGADSKHAVKVTLFTASVETAAGSQVSTVQLANDQGEFVLTPPYSYTTAIALPTTPTASTASTATAGTETLSIRFDLLVETAPGTGAYFRQTVLDDVVLIRGNEGVTK